MLAHQIQSPLLVQTIIDNSPGTVFFLIDLALAFVGTSAGTVYQTFMAECYGTDTCGKTQNALTALSADFLEVAGNIFYSYEKGVYCRDNWFL